MKRIFGLLIAVASAVSPIVGQTSNFSIITTTLPIATVNQSYSADILTTGAIGNLVDCTILTGTLPPGLSLTPVGTSCRLYGTPTVVRTDFFIVRAATTQQSATRSLSVTVSNQGTGTGGISIVTTSVPSGIVGNPYLFQFEASGYTIGGYEWSTTGGALPDGLILTRAGSLEGRPTVAGVFTFTVRVTVVEVGSDSRQFTMTVSGGQLRILETSIPFGIQGQQYRTTVTGAGGAPPYSWSLGGTSVVGLTIDAATGVITGTPQNAGNFILPVILTDAASTSATRQFSLFIATPLSVLTTSLPNGTPGTPYGQTLEAGGGQAPYSWTITAGALPNGLTLDRVTARIGGTPTVEGVYIFTVQVTDAGSRTATRELRITVGQGIQITTLTLPDGSVGVNYLATLAASGGRTPYTWSASGLPAGLALDSASGAISGTPSAVGSSTVNVTVTDSQQTTATKSFTLQVINPLVISTTQTSPATVGVAYAQAFGASGGTPPYAWSVTSGNLPPGLTLSASTAVVSGTPTEAGNFSFTLQVRDALQQTATRTFVITVTPALAIVTQSMSGSFNAAFSQSLQAAGGTPPLTWAVTGGTLPAGLALNTTTGAVTGTPTVSGTTTVTFAVTDSRGQTASRAIPITIGLPPLPPPSLGVTNPNNTPVGPAQQPPVVLTIGAPFPTEVTGVLTMTFTPLSGPDDPNVRFSNGQRTMNFTIPAGQTRATFPSVANGTVLTGTVAGTILITSSMTAGGANVTPNPAPTVRIVIEPAPPVIASVQLQQAAGGINVVVTGYSTTREVTSGLFRFAAATGSTLQTSEFTVPLGPAFTTWFGNPASAATGSQFTLTVPFGVQGSAAGVVSVSVTLTNSRGNSNTATP